MAGLVVVEAEGPHSRFRRAAHSGNQSILSALFILA